MENYEIVYDEYWREKVEDEYGNLDKDLVARELNDYLYTMQQAEALMELLSNGNSKNYDDDRDVILGHFINTVDTIKEVYSKQLQEEIAIKFLNKPKNKEYNKCLKDILKFIEEIGNG